MGVAFKIPSIFTAIDKFTGPVRAMGAQMRAFAKDAEVHLARSERMFRRITPSISNVGRELVSFAGDLSIAAVAALSIKSMMDYETGLQNLKALTGASGKEFDVFKTKIAAVAEETKTSSVNVVKAFTAIANNQPELLKDADALAAVTKSSIILAQAAGMELGPAGEALTTILNQFGKGAKDAAKTIDILAAGSVAGSSEINDTAEALQKFGTVADNFGVKINESVALIELGSKFQKGSEAGEKFRNILLTMANIKVQDPKALADVRRLGINMDIVSNTALPLAVRLKEMSKAGKDNAAIFHIFGKENAAMSAGILNSTDKFQGMLEAVNTSGQAAKMAAENNATFGKALQRLHDRFVTWITTAPQAQRFLDKMSAAAEFIADHLDTITYWATRIIAVFAVWWAINKVIWAVRGAIIAYKFATGAAAAFTEIFGISLWSALLPIIAIMAAIAALIFVVYGITQKWNEWGAALILVLGPLGVIISLIQSFRRNWDMITKAFSEGGILSGLKAIGATILDSILMPLQQLLKIIAKVSGWDWAQSAVDSIESFRQKIGVNTTTDESGNALNKTELVNPTAQRQNNVMEYIREHTNNAKVDLSLNDPNGRLNATSDSPLVNIKTSSTLAGAW